MLKKSEKYRSIHVQKIMLYLCDCRPRLARVTNLTFVLESTLLHFFGNLLFQNLQSALNRILRALYRNAILIGNPLFQIFIYRRLTYKCTRLLNYFHYLYEFVRLVSWNTMILATVETLK